MAWEGYWSRYGKYNDFNVYGLFGRDNPSLLATPEGLIEGKLLRAAFCESFVLDQKPFSSSTGPDKVSGGW
jgi:hypothetical protein